MNAGLKDLGERARAVGEIRGAYDEALAAERQAEAEVLAGVVEMVRPALRALSSAIPVGATTTPEGTTVEHAGWRGVFVSPAGPFKTAASPTAKDGWFYGSAFVLDLLGNFAELEYEGLWSAKGSRWLTRVTNHSPLGLIEANRKAALGVVDFLCDALRAQERSPMPEKTRDAQERAERLTHVAALLKGTP